MALLVAFLVLTSIASALKLSQFYPYGSEYIVLNKNENQTHLKECLTLQREIRNLPVVALQSGSATTFCVSIAHLITISIIPKCVQLILGVLESTNDTYRIHCQHCINSVKVNLKCSDVYAHHCSLVVLLQLLTRYMMMDLAVSRIQPKLNLTKPSTSLLWEYLA